MSLLKQMVRAPLSAKFGLLVIVVYILVALFAPVLAPYGETQVVGGASRRGAGSSCWAPITWGATCSAAWSTARATPWALPS
jgi:ABC-type dipeptide/oligopeptide/nickel transport system permease subunit